MKEVARARMAAGSVLATVSGVGIIFTALVGWSTDPRPWGFLLGAGLGLTAGFGVALAAVGMLEHRRATTEKS